MLKDPSLAEVQYSFGKVLWARGSPNAGEPFARAVELNPNLPDAIADYAFWYWFNVSEIGVADMYRRALDLDPLNVARYAALGHFLAINDGTTEVRALIARMEQLFDNATGYRAIAKLYELIGDVDHAIAWAVMARDAEPNNPLHIDILAEYYADIGEADIASTLDPDGIGVLFKLRRYEEMIDEAELLMIDYPGDFQLRAYLGYAYNVMERFDDAERIITTSGVLSVFSQVRRGTADTDAFSVLIDAAYGKGEIDKARGLTEWRLAKYYEANSSDWWIAFETACKNVILDNDDEARRLLRRVLESNHLPWEPMLKDHQCFKRFADDPDYLAVVKHFDDRRTLLRTRLPATLAEYGVSL